MRLRYNTPSSRSSSYASHSRGRSAPERCPRREASHRVANPHHRRWHEQGTCQCSSDPSEPVSASTQPSISTKRSALSASAKTVHELAASQGTACSPQIHIDPHTYRVGTWNRTCCFHLLRTGLAHTESKTAEDHVSTCAIASGRGHEPENSAGRNKILEGKSRNVVCLD